eukprot:9484579-Pyramimonas_sp.AAC.1
MRSSRLESLAGTGTCVVLRVRPMVRSGMSPPPSVKTWRQTVTIHVCRELRRPYMLSVIREWPRGSPPSNSTPIPSRRRTAQDVVALSMVKPSVVGHAVSQIAA